MSRIANIVKSLVATAAVAAAALAGTASADPGLAPGSGIPAVPGLTAGTGCSISCIVSAIVTPTASSALVKVTTSVPTSTTVSVWKLDAQLGLTTGTQPKHTTLPAFQTVRTVQFLGFEPETSYRISVTARDTSGRKQTRTGTFKTRAVQVAIDQPNLGLSAGLGCKADCIERGTAKAHATEVGRLDFDVRLTEPGKAQLDLYLPNGSGGLKLQRSIYSGTGIEMFTPTADGLIAGVKYTVRLKATDARGFSRVEWGSVRTARARATVIFHKLHVIDDGETGNGEIAFYYHVEDLSRGGNGFHKIGSGDTVAAVGSGTSRETVTFETSIDGHLNLDLGVLGVECDNTLMKNCVTEAFHDTSGEYAGDTYVMAKAAFGIAALLDSDGALPPGYGTGLPAGHDAYLVWENTGYDMKFRVYATVDFEVVS